MQLANQIVLHCTQAMILSALEETVCGNGLDSGRCYEDVVSKTAEYAMVG